jgi:hypothetical protein
MRDRVLRRRPGVQRSNYSMLLPGGDDGVRPDVLQQRHRLHRPDSGPLWLPSGHDPVRRRVVPSLLLERPDLRHRLSPGVGP